MINKEIVKKRLWLLYNDVMELTSDKYNFDLAECYFDEEASYIEIHLKAGEEFFSCAYWPADDLWQMGCGGVLDSNIGFDALISKLKDCTFFKDMPKNKFTNLPLLSYYYNSNFLIYANEEKFENRIAAINKDGVDQEIQYVYAVEQLEQQNLDKVIVVNANTDQKVIIEC